MKLTDLTSSAQKYPFLHFLLILVLAVLTFPEFEPVISTGLDSSYVFGFNYFFDIARSHGDKVIFSYGPLGFIRFPLLIGNNFAIAFWLTLLVQILFVWLIYRICIRKEKGGLILFIAIGLLLTANLRIDEKLMGCVAFGLLLHAQTKERIYLFIVAVITAFSFFVKLNIAAAAVMMTASYLILDFIRNKQFNNFLIVVVPGFVLYFLTWMLIYHSLDGCLLHLRNWMLISNGNLGATSVNAPNNKLLLSFLLLAVGALWLLFRSKNITTVYVIFAFSLWAVFRYSIAREENYHAKAFFEFLILFVAAVFLAGEKIKLLHIPILILIPWLYYQNMIQTGKFDIEVKMKYGGIHNFKESLRIFSKEGKDYYNGISKQNLAIVQLADSAIKVLGNNTVDIFPWENSYFAANSLNFVNRPLFQLGCVNNETLDTYNAEFLSSEKAPHYYIWTKQNWFGAEMSSIDHRYILSDDGQIVFALLNNYAQVYDDEKVRILERTATPKFSTSAFAGQGTIPWNEWVPVPELPQGHALRIKFVIEKTFAGKIKHGIYKEPEYYMLYQLEDSTEKKHRLVVQNSQSGIWVAPYLETYNDNLQGKKVKAIKMIYTDRDFVYTPEFKVEWEQIRLQ